MQPITTEVFATRRRADSALPLVFGCTLFLSALLLFTIQPLFAKMALPKLGGTPAVWSIAMVFFQSVLLAGYAYAHLLVRLAGLGLSLLIHAGVLGLGLLWLPLGIAAGFEMPPQTGLPLWLLGLFAASTAVPFFAVSANAPLLQAWFSRTCHEHARDPYFLYGASNFGSVLALLSYPIVMEPLLTLSGQSAWWRAGYFALIAGVIGCGILTLSRGGGGARQAMAELAAPKDVPSLRRRLQWVGLAFLPSAMLVAVTAHLSANIAAAPFLWVLPLALFLLTFVMTFQRSPLIPGRAFELLLPVVVIAISFASLASNLNHGLFGIALHLSAFGVIAMAWHSALSARRPDASRLTEFYFCMSVGGVLGGAFTSLAAPVLFDTILEYPLLLAASFLVMPEARRLIRLRWAPVVLAAPVLFWVAASWTNKAEIRERSFFGVIAALESEDERFRVLIHGNTVHGAERIDDLADPSGAKGRPESLTYYSTNGPLAGAMRLARATATGAFSVGVVGLGTGSLACYSEPGDSWRFFEIDPAIIRVATDPKHFTFMSSCAPSAPILAGDARLTLEGEPDASYDVLVIDAFSSDAIPVHLVTREALHMYTRKLKPNGVVVLHISNRYMDLAPVLGSTAAAEGLSAVTLTHRVTEEQSDRMHTSSEAVVLARSAEALAPYMAAGWRALGDSSGEGVDAWTDDYSNVLGAILRRNGFL